MRLQKPYYNLANRIAYLKDTELPLGVLPVDAAPVLITLGNQDVLNAIENFKQSNGVTGVTPNNDDSETLGDAKPDNNEKENNNK